MNKKIKAVVKNYEKNMKFESKFEQLSHKLDLIKDDTPPKSDVIIIRRKLIPAYMMSMLLIALVTGLIGLQIGLGNLKIKTEYINPIELELQKHVDVYTPFSIDSTILGEDLLVNYYIGMRQGREYVIISLNSNSTLGTVKVTNEQETYQMNFSNDDFWLVIEHNGMDNMEFTITYKDSKNETFSKSIVLNLNGYYEYLESIN